MELFSSTVTHIVIEGKVKPEGQGSQFVNHC